MVPFVDNELTNEQIDELKDAFNRYDLDSNGTISVTEMRLALISMGYAITEAELYDIINSVTTEKEHEMTLPQFMQMMAPRLADVDSSVTLRRTFNVIDRDHDGYINSQDVRTIMLILGEVVTDDEVKDICHAVDMDGDGRISRRDFINFMHSPI
ncbi:calmodulin-A [Drosophila eugracilis]|uniref:calmodulin-A n=1 Tax=Drosophila eugracilis TaxID=29029 RepID=UPI0007E82BEB|nr:calmodulin-A [Drosophila eugracilis]